MAARIKGKMERTSSWSYLCRRIGFLTAASLEKKDRLRLIVTLKVVNVPTDHPIKTQKSEF